MNLQVIGGLLSGVDKSAVGIEIDLNPCAGNRDDGLVVVAREGAWEHPPLEGERGRHTSHRRVQMDAADASRAGMGLHMEQRPHTNASARVSGVEARLERMLESTRRYEVSDRDAFRRFQERFFGPSARQLEEARFQWLFYTNPGGNEPQVWVCSREGEVVGQQSGILHRLRVGTTEVGGSWAIDLMVDPAWRLRGVGPALAERHARSHDIVVALGATDALYPVLLKSGWVDLGHIPARIRPLRLSALSPWWRQRGSRFRVAARLAGPVLQAANSWNDLRCRTSRLRVEPIAAFDARADRIWEHCATDYPVIARRDATWLGWRFDRSPDAALYQRYLVLQGSDPVGYFVLREGTMLDAPVCFLVDYLSSLNNTGVLLDFVVAKARRTHAAALVSNTLNVRAESVFARAGFLSIQKRTRRRFLFRLQRELATLDRVVGDRANWFVTRADSDTDHPGPHPDGATES